MIVNGIELSDLAGLAHENNEVIYPEQVPGRTVHIDADFLAYQCSAEKADGTDDKTFDDMKHNAEVAVESLRALAGAEKVHLHLTPSTSSKGDRYDLALLKPYQGNREDKEKPRYLNIMREWLAKRFPGTLHQFCEADDGMAAAQYAAIAAGDAKLSIIASKDKDLRMVPGLHLDWDMGIIRDIADPWGHVILVEHVAQPSGTKTKMLKGYGEKWFWAQMLIGDAADNISGLPAVPGHVMNHIQPTKEIEKALSILSDDLTSPRAREMAEKKLADRKEGKCGPVTANLILDLIDDRRTAFQTIKGLYKRYGETTGFFNYRTNEPVPWGKAFASEGQLLWMRKQPTNANCVLDYWRECAA